MSRFPLLAAGRFEERVGHYRDDTIGRYARGKEAWLVAALSLGSLRGGEAAYACVITRAFEPWKSSQRSAAFKSVRNPNAFYIQTGASHGLP